ncbi:MAG TPA: 30S ribosomal protein S20 [Vicinamibacterales bacterium]|nr:30S ribosomal protein S20 [Vicinamibacterales bacterium]
MATHKSAEKAHRQSLRRRERRRAHRSRLRTALRALRAAIDRGDRAAAERLLGATVGLIDRMAVKGIIHRNAAARYKSRLMKRLRRAEPAAA